MSVLNGLAVLGVVVRRAYIWIYPQEGEEVYYSPHGDLLHIQNPGEYL